MTEQASPGRETYLLLATVGVIGVVFALATPMGLADAIAVFQWQVLAIYISLDLFFGMVMKTGIVEWGAVRMAMYSGGRRLVLLVSFAAITFLASGFLNNLATVLVLLPLIFVLLRAMRVDARFVGAFFATMLAMTNLGGASTPIGDFPALIIMASGLTTFPDYLARAWPLCLVTSMAVLLVHFGLYRLRVGQKVDPPDIQQRLNQELRLSESSTKTLDRRSLSSLAMIFFLMFLGWALLPPDEVPPEVIAVVGLGLGAVVTGSRISPKHAAFDLEASMRIGAFLFAAAVVQAAGILDLLGGELASAIDDPLVLMVAFMLLTSAMSALCSAAPAAAAMLPIAQQLADGPLAAQEGWIAVAFAASICAGSSAFVWSATSGLLLADKINSAGLADDRGRHVTWGIRAYLPLGVLNYTVQIIIAIAWILTMCHLEV